MSNDAGTRLRSAIDAARSGAASGGIPIGSALFINGALVATGHNRRVQDGSVIHHAEMNCLENAGRLPASDYARATLVTTLSPCDMCTGAVLLYGIPRVIVGENRTFLGGEDLLRSRGVEVTVLDDRECVEMMTEFIASHPALWAEDIGEDEPDGEAG
jgi:cytosine/creatinine deaminase